MSERDVERLARRLAELIRAELTALAGTELAGELEVILKSYLTQPQGPAAQSR